MGTGTNDLSLIGLLLTIFGFGIIAYALMQDQINKNILLENGMATNVQTNSQPTVQPVHNASAVNTDAVVADKKETNVDETVKRETVAEVSMKEIQLLREYKALFDEGIITEEEFEFKKKELLG